MEKAEANLEQTAVEGAVVEQAVEGTVVVQVAWVAAAEQVDLEAD